MKVRELTRRLESQSVRLHDDDEDPRLAEAHAEADEALEAAIDSADRIAKQLLIECIYNAKSSKFAHLNLLKKGANEMKSHFGS